ncbi:MAG TPA: phosphotransferase [Streptosporangiaceae bacterium]|nr:phosphotransferase [Streptosporangiaceae bacterium]
MTAPDSGAKAAPPDSGAKAAPSDPETVLLDYDPFARMALRPFGFSPGAHISLLSLSENATYRIDDPADGRTAVLRVHRTGYHQPGAVASELAWLQALRVDEGLRTPAVFPAADGREVVDIQIGPVTRQTVLFEWLPGTEPPDEQLAEKFELLGEISGRMHRHSRGWARPESFVRFSWDFDCCIGSKARWGRWQDGLGMGRPELETLGRAAALLADRLRRFGAGPDRFGLIHADMRLANLLVSGPDIQVIDFDDCGFGWFLFDLGTALSFFEHDRRVPELCEAWLRGYRRILPLPAEDAAEIPTFILLRRLQLVAWVGSHRFADSARELGADFTTGACELAERYLVTTK